MDEADNSISGTVIPTTNVNGRQYITVDGIMMLRAALGLPPIRPIREFFGDFKGWHLYMRGVREETLRACHPSMFNTYEND